MKITKLNILLNLPSTSNAMHYIIKNWCF